MGFLNIFFALSFQQQCGRSSESAIRYFFIPNFPASIRVQISLGMSVQI